MTPPQSVNTTITPPPTENERPIQSNQSNTRRSNTTSTPNPINQSKTRIPQVEAYGRGVCEERAAAIVRQAALGLLYMKRSHRIAHRYVRVGVGGCL